MGPSCALCDLLDLKTCAVWEVFRHCLHLMYHDRTVLYKEHASVDRDSDCAICLCRGMSLLLIIEWMGGVSYCKHFQASPF